MSTHCPLINGRELMHKRALNKKHLEIEMLGTFFFFFCESVFSRSEEKSILVRGKGTYPGSESMVLRWHMIDISTRKCASRA